MAPRRRLDDYAKNQRRIRSLQPRVSSAEAHEQARQALAEAARTATTTPEPSPGSSSAKASNSSAGRKKTGGSSTAGSKNAS